VDEYDDREPESLEDLEDRELESLEDLDVLEDDDDDELDDEVLELLDDDESESRSEELLEVDDEDVEDEEDAEDIEEEVEDDDDEEEDDDDESLRARFFLRDLFISSPIGSVTVSGFIAATASNTELAASSTRFSCFSFSSCFLFSNARSMSSLLAPLAFNLSSICNKSAFKARFLSRSSISGSTCFCNFGLEVELFVASP
jgi:hypothetical protein